MRVKFDSLLAIGSQRVDESHAGMSPNIGVIVHHTLGPGAFPHESHTAILEKIACPDLTRDGWRTNIVLVHQVLPVLDRCDRFWAVQNHCLVILGEDTTAKLPQCGGLGVI